MTYPRFEGSFSLDPPLDSDQIAALRAFMAAQTLSSPWTITDDGARLVASLDPQPAPLSRPELALSTVEIELPPPTRLDGSVWVIDGDPHNTGVIEFPPGRSSVFRSIIFDVHTARVAQDQSGLSAAHKAAANAAYERLTSPLGVVRDPLLRARPIEDLELSVRTEKLVRKHRIATIGGLADHAISQLQGPWGNEYKETRELLAVFAEHPWFQPS